MDLPKSNSEESKRVSYAAEEVEEPPMSIDPSLVDATRDPQCRKYLRQMEAKIQQVLICPNLNEVDFDRSYSPHPRELVRKLAVHYGFEPHCTEGRRVYATKTPDSKLPSVTISSLVKSQPSSGAASSSTSSVPEMTDPAIRVRTGTRNEPAPASSISPIHNGMVYGQHGISARFGSGMGQFGRDSTTG